MAGESLPILIKELVGIRQRMKADEARRKELETLIPEAMEEQGIQSSKTTEGIAFWISETPKIEAWPNDVDEMHEDLIAAGAADLVKEKVSVHNASLRAWVKERLADGQPVPESIGYRCLPALSIRANGWSAEDV